MLARHVMGGHVGPTGGVRDARDALVTACALSHHGSYQQHSSGARKRAGAVDARERAAGTARGGPRRPRGGRGGA